MKNPQQKTKPVNPHFFFLCLVSLWIYILSWEEVKGISFPLTNHKFTDLRMLQTVWILKPYYDHGKWTGPLCHFLMCKSGLTLINHSDINKRKGSARCPLLSTSHINGFNFKGNEIFYSENPECIVVQCWIVREMVHSWWSGTPATCIPFQPLSRIYWRFYCHLETLTFCRLYGEPLMISEMRMR